MDIEQHLMDAMNAEQPMWQLWETVQTLLAHGRSRQDLLHDLERLRRALIELGRDQDEDSVLEVLDFLTGWCTSDMRL